MAKDHQQRVRGGAVAVVEDKGAFSPGWDYPRTVSKNFSSNHTGSKDEKLWTISLYITFFKDSLLSGLSNIAGDLRLELSHSFEEVGQRSNTASKDLEVTIKEPAKAANGTYPVVIEDLDILKEFETTMEELPSEGHLSTLKENLKMLHPAQGRHEAGGAPEQR